MNDTLTVQGHYDADGNILRIVVHLPDGATYDDVGATVRMLARALQPPAPGPEPMSAAATVVMNTPRQPDPLDTNTDITKLWPANR